MPETTLRELMEMQWEKKGVEYTQHYTAWVYRNKCLIPSRGNPVSIGKRARYGKSNIRKRST